MLNGSLVTKCKLSMAELKTGPFTLVIFGGAGDLSQRKLLPALYQLYQQKFISKFTIIGIGRTKYSTVRYRQMIREALERRSTKISQDFCRNLHYIAGDSSDDELYRQLCGEINSSYKRHKTRNVLFYLAVPQQVTPIIIDKLTSHRLCITQKISKVVLEKPFGHDKKSAVKLNRKILDNLYENQVYRMDHYLGKETVQNIIFFRFANSIFESIWNSDCIDSVQITVAEELGIGNRGGFYEQAGVVRDMVQNHIMQLISLVAMEPPMGFSADLIRDKKVEVLRALKAVKDGMVLGQYKSYRREENVKKNSRAPSYFAGKFYINNKRWKGVPFYVRTGKKLKRKLTEIAVVFKRPLLQFLAGRCGGLMPNVLVLRIQPSEGIHLQFAVKTPGVSNIPQQVAMNFAYQELFKIEPLQAYERLLLDCIRGDQTLFARHDEVEEMWRVVNPLLTTTERIEYYADGGEGPTAAAKLLIGDKRQWHTSLKKLIG